MSLSEDSLLKPFRQMIGKPAPGKDLGGWYTYDDTESFQILEHTSNAALPGLPGRSVENGMSWRPDKDSSYNNDESYTLSENLFLAYQRGAEIGAALGGISY